MDCISDVHADWNTCTKWQVAYISELLWCSTFLRTHIPRLIQSPWHHYQGQIKAHELTVLSALHINYYFFAVESLKVIGCSAIQEIPSILHKVCRAHNHATRQCLVIGQILWHDHTMGKRAMKIWAVWAEICHADCKSWQISSLP